MQRCVFAPALASGCVRCWRADRSMIAERESIACTDAIAARRCAEFEEVLVAGARFARHLEPGSVLSYAQRLDLQCGVLQALRKLTSESSESPAGRRPAPCSVDGRPTPDGSPSDAGDVCDTLDRAFATYGVLESFPFAQLMRVVASIKPRSRRRR